MEQKRSLLFIVAILLVPAALVSALPFGPRLVPEAIAVQVGNAPTPLSVSELIKASLEFSGANPATVAADTARFRTIIAEAKKAVASYSTAYNKGNALLVFMHERLLTHYSLEQARIDTLLRTGVFNCVSSAVVYMILGRAVGLEVEGVYTPDHAFCTVRARGRLIDVETTNRYGFDPGTKTAFRTAFGETGFNYVPPGNYRLRTPTNGKGLLSFILQDRMVVLERQRLYSEAVGLAVDRHTVLQSQASLNDLTSEATNYCALLNRRGQYAPAVSFLATFEKHYGRQPRLEKVMSGLLHNEVLGLMRKGAYSDALAVIHSPIAAGWLKSQAAASLTQMVAERRLMQALHDYSFDRALAEVKSSYRQGDVSPSVYRSFLVILYGRQARKTADSQGFLAAAKVLDQGIRLTGGDPQLERGKRVYLHNYVASVHNRFAALFNNREYSKASQVISEGLKEVPGSSILNQDLRLLRHASGG